MKRMLVLMLLLSLLSCPLWAEEEAAEGGAAVEVVEVITSAEAEETAEEQEVETAVAEATADVEVADSEPVAETPEPSRETGAAAALAAARAAEVDDGAQIYVIKKGDTLWGISKRFIKDPEYWPNLWANNPFVTNPHLIYPGQKIKFHDGRIEIVPTSGEDEMVEVIEAEDASGGAAQTIAEELPQVVPVKEIKLRVAGGEGYVIVDELESVGMLADTVDNRYLMVAGDTVFVVFDELGAVRPGDRFDVVRPVGRVMHPRNGRYLGEKISELGVIEVRQVHAEVATAVVVENNFEMQRGDKLKLHKQARQDIVLKKAPAGVTGVVADARRAGASLSQNDFIYVDVGSDDGLEKGNMLYISRERRATELAAVQNLRLPDRLMGAALLVDVREDTSTALILKSVDVILRGDKVFTQAD